MFAVLFRCVLCGARRFWSRPLVRLLPIFFCAGFAFSEPHAEPLTLAEASRRALAGSPELQIFEWRFKALAGKQKAAELAPGYALGVEAENIGGSAENGNAEFTLALSSLIELGDKRERRIAAANSRYAQAEFEREAAALDVLGNITQIYITALSLQEKLKVTKTATRLSESALELVKRRVERGAAPEAERLRAEATVVQARLQQYAVTTQLENRKFAMAALWGAEQVDFGHLAGNLFAFDVAADFDTLDLRTQNNPAIKVFAQEARLRDADLALARSQSIADVSWSLGVRHYEASNDAAFVAGASIPLLAGKRNRGDIETALAEREAVSVQKRDALLALRTRLFDAWQSYQNAVNATQQIRSYVLPALEAALTQTRSAYEQGRYRYIDWVSAQRELLDAKGALIDAARTALLSQAVIEQLTAEPLSQNTSPSSALPAFTISQRGFEPAQQNSGNSHE